MDNIVYIVFRRMRQPLLTLLLAYSISILGLVLIPGQDDAGQPWHMGFFHAFYFVSFTSTTIGFGEIPYPFTDVQRMWVIFTIYATVISWIYAIGTLLALIQGEAFQNALTVGRFARRIRRLTDPFILVAGYGSIGRELVMALTDRQQHVVVLDSDQQRINVMGLQNLREDVPGFCGNAKNPGNLMRAGLSHPKCAAVVALTDSNAVNLKVAITSKLLRPELTVVCRADSVEVEKNMESFGTDYIVDPFEPDEEKAFADMQFQGYEKDRQTLKFRCPAAAFGLECRNREACRCRPGVRDGDYGRVVRVPLERDRRIFLPTHRHSRGFREAYKKRSSVERVNSRIDQVYGFEHHFIRGLKKMRLRVGLALIVMLATAVAWVRAGRKEKLRSLVQAA